MSTSRSDRRTIGAAAALVAGSFVLVYWPVVVKLIHDWATDDNYSHGFLIVPIASYLAWERRKRFFAAPRRPSLWGLALVAGSLGLLVAGTLGAELFLTRISLVGVVAGTTLFLCGWRQLRIWMFPIAFLLLMIPIPAILFNQVAFPLQLLASRFGEAALGVVGVPVLREGNVITLANTQLEVAEACSGIRSLVSLLTLAIVFGYFADSRGWVRAIISLASIPVAILTNGLRVAGTGIAAHYYGPQAAEGFLHTFSGWLVFVTAIFMLVAIQKTVSLVAPTGRPRGPRRPRRPSQGGPITTAAPV